MEFDAYPTTASIYLNDEPINSTAYSIHGNSFFKLRDIAELINFSVEWDNVRKQINVETVYRYVPENAEPSYLFRCGINIPNTNKTVILNWAEVSPLQQFLYIDEGLAYAYAVGDVLKIVTPSKEIDIEMLYPKQGDVIADDRNFYIVWGRDNDTDNYSTETMFITKYTNTGDYVDSMGFI